MEIAEILSELERNRGYFPREAVEAAIEQREEITPHLLRAIEEAVEHPEEVAKDGYRFLHLYGMYIFAQFREHRAYPLIAMMCKLPHDLLDGLIGETITEGLCQILASVCDGDTAPIKWIIEDASLDEYVRGTAIRSLPILVHADMIPREDVVSYFVELFRAKLDKGYSHVWDVLASEAVRLYAKELAHDIRRRYQDGLLDGWYMSPERVDETFALEEEAVLARSKERSRGLIDDVVSEMQWWACFKPKDRKRRWKKPRKPSPVAAGRHDPGAIVRETPRVTRNQPCPCGSGKKYKRCCGAA